MSKMRGRVIALICVLALIMSTASFTFAEDTVEESQVSNETKVSEVTDVDNSSASSNAQKTESQSSPSDSSDEVVVLNEETEGDDSAARQEESSGNAEETVAVNLPEGEYTYDDSVSVDFDAEDEGGIAGSKSVSASGDIDVDQYKADLAELYPDASIKSEQNEDGTTVFYVTEGTDQIKITVSQSEREFTVTLGDVELGPESEVSVYTPIFSDRSGLAWSFNRNSRYNNRGAKYQFLDEIIYSNLYILAEGERLSPVCIVLADESGNKYYTYCVDMHTAVTTRAQYDEMKNIDQADYFTEEEAAMLRTIVTYGYYGVNPGNNADNPTPGSLAFVKKNLKEAIENGTFSYEGLTPNLVDNLNPRQAMAATQAAIWVYGNRTEENPVSENVLYSHPWYSTPSTNDYLLVKGLYNYLISLEPAEATGENHIINDASIKSASVIINANDLKADVNVELAVDLADVVGELVANVWEVDENGNTVGDNPIATKSLKGSSGTEFTISDVLIPASKLVMIQLAGEQELVNNGAYIFTGADGQDTTQTLITRANGTNNVDLRMMLSIVYAETAAVEVSTETITADDEEDSDDEDSEENNKKESSDKESNKDDSVETGDNTNLFIPVSLMILAAFGMVASIGAKRREN